MLACDVTGPAGEVIARAGLPVQLLDGGRANVRPLLRDFEQKVADLVASCVSLSTQRALETVRKARPTAPLARGRLLEEMPAAIRAFIDICAEPMTAGGYLLDRVAAEDEAGHAIGVAALTARICGLIGLDAAEREAAVMAALLHDVGMVFVPRSIRMTPPIRRSIPERIRYEDHAILGEAILGPLGEPSMHLSIVAGEHHEQADGGGYPRKLSGGHRVLRTAEEKRNLDRVTLVSEIVLVADTYERAVSPSPGITGCSPATARLLLNGLAGSALNGEIVRRFLDSFPALPVGTDVRVTAGLHTGMSGIVCGIPEGLESRPVVRLFLDARGYPIDEVIEVELARERETAVEVLEAA